MCKMDTKAFIWNLLWTILLMSTYCESGTLNITEESTTITTATTAMAPPKTLHNTMVLCQCGPGKVMNHTGQCQPWVDGTTVPMKPSPNSKTQFVDTTEMDFTVKEPQCQYRKIDLQEDQFLLRPRGDLLVTVGDLRGLRLADYCIHHQQSEGQVKVTARGCVSLPVIPRCCPLGKHIINGDCVTQSINSIPFNPSLYTGPDGDMGLAGAPFPWDDRQEQIDKLNCTTGHVMKKIELDGQKAYLSVLPQFVLLTWHPEGDQRQYSHPPQYCVDVPGDDGKYYAYSCQKDLEVYCKNKICTNKCCPEGQAMSMETKGCVPSDLPFTPPFPRPPKSLETIYNFPSCNPITDIDNFQLLEDGTLIHRSNIYSFDKFCMDTFIKANSAEPGALACIKEIQASTWHNVRRVVFPVCNGISCVFLMALFLLNAWIPKLREDGRYQLLHAASLFMAYSSSLIATILVPKGYMVDGACEAIAFVMQFAFLSAFFWLNTMCFAVWRLSRNFVKNIYSHVPSVAVWKYLLYGLGGPLTITVITIIIQFAAPKDDSILGLVHPRIGEGRCWFKSDKELLAYFYGPVSVLFLVNFVFICITYRNLRIIRGGHKSADNLNGYTGVSEEDTAKEDLFAAFRQRFCLLVLIAGCWFTEILSWKIPPEELWSVTDMLNNLQGVFVFFVFLAPYNKRALLKKHLPKIFLCSNFCINHAKTAQTSISYSAKKLSKKTYSSTASLTMKE